jgi:hypothetical protein
VVLLLQRSPPAPVLRAGQFAAACGEFVRPQGFPRPFAALDWCPHCGQPDWAHQADGPDRLLRLDGLDSGDMTCALAYLAEYSPATFDTILDALGPADRIPGDEASEEPYCATCGAPLGIFLADGPFYRHYRDDEDDCQRYSVDHPTVIGWRATRP